ncbi:MAG: glycoside hydrolase family 172 protein [Vicinamibacteraceae bacterium]
MLRARLLILSMIAAAWLACAAPALAQQPIGIDALARLDLLPRFKPSVAVGMVSSYDRTGGNDDGFSGKHSFLRKDPEGLVIADLKGPGVVYRIWTPTPTDDVVEFYFDGETAARLRVPMRDLFTGRTFPFVSPVVGIGAGGFYAYVPLAYAQSLKVVVKAEKVQFYQINYATYASGTAIETYGATPAAIDRFRVELDRAAKLVAATGTDISAASGGPGAALKTTRFDGALRPGQRLTIFETASPGRIAGLRLGPARAFAAKARDLVLNIYWDGAKTPAITGPVGDLFGYSFGDPATRSFLIGTADDTNYLYLPMPFATSARIELVSERASGPAIDVHAEIIVSNVARRPDEGALYASWRREREVTTGQPFTFLDVRGRGHAVAFFLQAQGTEPGGVPTFFEGDDQATIDGALVAHGTGSEDFFNGGWYDVPGRWEDRVSLPFSGSLDFKRHLGRTGGYRLLLGDAYAFRESVKTTIEHGPTGNAVPADYTSVTWLYAERPPDGIAPLTAVEGRAVHDPEAAVFTPGWTTPIHAFSWTNATLTKRSERIAGREFRYLAFAVREAREVFGPHYLSLICELPAAGRYTVAIEAVEGPAQGRVQLFRNEVAIGEAADFFGAGGGVPPRRTLGTLDFLDGPNRVMLKMVGRHDQSTGMNLDIYRLIFTRVGQ